VKIMIIRIMVFNKYYVDVIYGDYLFWEFLCPTING